MKEMLELFLALCVTFGLFLLGWWLLGRLLRPGKSEELWLIVPARGGGETLEHTLGSLRWLRRAGLLRCSALIVDRGLTPAGVRLASLLAEREGAALVGENDPAPWLEE
ncbi:MAG: hypothetical protein RSB55_01210 [Oscillospiraceae bacterium]